MLEPVSAPPVVVRPAVTPSLVAPPPDLVAAGDLQRALLPPSPFAWGGWSAEHRYEPAGIVGGDYLDLVPEGDRLYFMLGDVAGKGFLASLLVAELHAMFRALVPGRPSIESLLSRASALLCHSSLPWQYATAVAGYLGADGEVVIGNAGHPPPLAIEAGRPREVRATGVPVGMFCESEFSTTRLRLGLGDTLLVYTDGLTEGMNNRGEEYGGRLERLVAGAAHTPLAELLDATLVDQAAFRDGAPNVDDLTVLAIRRTASAAAGPSRPHRCA